MCHAPEVAYTPSDFLGWSQWQMFISQIGHRGGQRLGHNLTQLAGGQGLCTALPDGGQCFTASVCCGQSLLLSLSRPNRLLRGPRDAVAPCRSGGQPEQTHDMMKLKLLLDRDSRQQKPHTH